MKSKKVIRLKKLFVQQASQEYSDYLSPLSVSRAFSLDMPDDRVIEVIVDDTSLKGYVWDRGASTFNWSIPEYMVEHHLSSEEEAVWRLGQA